MLQDFVDDEVGGAIVGDAQCVGGGLEGSKLAIEEVGIHVVILAFGEALGDQMLGAVEQDEVEGIGREAADEGFPVSILQGGAGKDASLAGFEPLEQEAVKGFEPGLTVLVGEGVAGGHLRLIGGGMVGVGIRERRRHAVGEKRSYGGLS